MEDFVVSTGRISVRLFSDLLMVVTKNITPKIKIRKNNAEYLVDLLIFIICLKYTGDDGGGTLRLN